MKKGPNKKTQEELENEKFPLPVYSADEDIYSKEKELPLEEEIQEKTDSRATQIGDDLDVPGSELDDADENIGEEDEENNYYSIGGDDHNELEEDQEGSK
jgi:hypothetical protein